MNLIGVDVDAVWLVCRISRRGVGQPLAKFPNTVFAPFGDRDAKCWGLKNLVREVVGADECR